jgi:hypothetical protein
MRLRVLIVCCRGCIDLVRMRCILWPPGTADDGRVFDNFPIARVEEGGGGVLEECWASHAAAAGGIVTRAVVAQALRLRQELCYAAADAAAADGDDDGLGDACISSDGCLPTAQLMSSLRRSCCSRACMPGTHTRAALVRSPLTSAAVLLGTALRNRGVQPLLDAIVDFLPAPPEPACSSPSPDTLALAFKTVFDVKMGQELTYVRVYSGILAPKQTLHVINSSGGSGGSGGGGGSSSSSSSATERASSIFRISADEVQPLQQV